MNGKLFRENFGDYENQSFDELVSHIKRSLDRLQENKNSIASNAEEQVGVQNEDFFQDLMKLMEDKIFKDYEKNVDEVMKNRRRSKEKELNLPNHNSIKRRKSISNKIKSLNIELKKLNSDLSDKDITEAYEFLGKNSPKDVGLNDYLSTKEDDNRLFIKRIALPNSPFSIEYVEVNPKYESNPKSHNQYQDLGLIYKTVAA